MGVGQEEPVVVQAGERRSARLEGVRALAALGVLVGHTWGTYKGYTADAFDGLGDRLLIGGGIGVFVFFALTGYLLYWPFVRRDLLGGDRVDLRSYARNRVLRIVPLYLVVVAVVLLWREDGGTLRQWALFMTFSENFAADTIGQVNGALWSVVVELHFYVLLPVLAAGLAAVSRGRMLLVTGVLLAIAAVSLGLWLERADTSPLWRYNLPATFYFFVSGMLLAVLRGAIETRAVRLRGLAGSSTVWVLASLPFFLVAMHRVRAEPVAIGSFLLVGACALPLRHGAAVRVLGCAPLAFLGVISYSIYIWQDAFLDQFHESINGTPQLVMTIPVVLVVSWVSFRVIETPFLRLRRRWATGAAAQVAGPVAAGAGDAAARAPVAAG